MSPSVQASWISWTGIGCTLGAGVATFFSPGGTVVAGGLGIAEILLVFTDCYLWATSRGLYGPGGSAQLRPAGPTPNQAITPDQYPGPSFAAGTSPPPFTTHIAEFMTAQFQHFQLSGNPDDNLVQATNATIDSFNQFLAHANQGAASNVIKQDLTNLTNALQNKATQHDNLVASGYYKTITMSQADLNNSAQNIRQNGLLQVEIDSLRNAGLSDNFIQAYTQNEASQTLTISKPTITVSDLLHAAKDQAAQAVNAF